MEHCRNAIPDLKIGFLLLSGAQNLKLSVVCLQLSHEIDKYSMRASLSHDICKSVDPGFHLEGMAICRDESLTGQLGGTIKGDWKKWTIILRRGNNGSLAVDSRCGGKSNSAHTAFSHSLQKVIGGHHVLR